MSLPADSAVETEHDPCGCIFAEEYINEVTESSSSTVTVPEEETSPFARVRLSRVVKGAVKGDPISAPDLWRERMTVVFVTRRPGCYLCREDAMALSAAHMNNEWGDDVNLVAVIKEVAPVASARTDLQLGVEEFQVQYFNSNPVFLDTEKDFYKFFGMKSALSQKLNSWNPFALYEDYNAMSRRIKSKGIHWNSRGEGIIQGGIVVVSPTKGIVYQRNELTGTELPMRDITHAILTAKQT